MSARLPSLKALRALEATARHRSLTKAADELNVTVAAISRQLKTLEHEFGERLFRRRGGTLEVAAAVEAGLEDLRIAFEHVALGVKKIRQHGVHRPLTIAVEPSFAATWLLRRLPQFNEAHPDISIRLETSLRVVDLGRERDIDLGIRYGDGDYPGHRVAMLLPEEVFPVCSPKLLEGDHPLRTPADLRWHTLLHDDFQTADTSMPKWSDWLEAAKCDADARKGPHFPLTSMIVEAAVLGHGVGLAGQVIAGGYLATGALVRPFGTAVSTPVDFAYYLVCINEVADSSDVCAFWEWALRQAQKEALDELDCGS